MFFFTRDILSNMERKNDIEKLTLEIRKLNQNFSWHMSLIRGITGGFGTAIGASVLVAFIVILFQQLTELPILGDLFAFLLGNLK